MCHSQAQDLLVVQGRQIIRLDQGKLRLAQEERQISFFPNAKRNGQTKPTVTSRRTSQPSRKF